MIGHFGIQSAHFFNERFDVPFFGIAGVATRQQPIDQIQFAGKPGPLFKKMIKLCIAGRNRARVGTDLPSQADPFRFQAIPEICQQSLPGALGKCSCVLLR